MPNIFDFFRLIEKTPEIFLTYLADERKLQLRALMIIIAGYTEAVRAHNIEEPLRNFNDAFGQYLRKRFGWSTAPGPIGAIIAASPTADIAWNSFWALLWDFEKSLDLR